MPNRGHTATRAVFLGAALTAVAMTVAASLDRDAYFYYWEEDRAKWTYPIAGVAVVLVLVLAETVFTYYVFTARRPRSFWVRATVGLLVLGAWGSALLVAIVHAPMFYMLHLLYVWLLAAAVALALGVSLARRGLRWLWPRVAQQTRSEAR